ncbi:FIG000605: protein co-occurring with transport systems (COG1739) [hydrothermal vent metagenome]|uniref:FIG000605: protein co-occurring with transport systems (COG1739) n=1 Tax=hydrothermal vent metagenome TaxID=652676 RepID=A0A1W1CD87_9ZZZZ
MKYVKNISNNTLEVKQSKFIAWLTPYDTYKITLETLKIQHPKARHFVTAYRYLNEFEQIVEHLSDDGEPKGTSGKPSLMVLQGQELINTAVIIVRYFGGTKLGTGGLVRAYSDAVNLVLNEASFEEYKKEKEVSIEIEYSNIRFINYECKAFNVSILEKFFENKTIYKIKADEKSMEKFLEKVKRIVKIVPKHN